MSKTIIGGLELLSANQARTFLFLDPAKSINAKLKFWNLDLQGLTSTLLVYDRASMATIHTQTTEDNFEVGIPFPVAELGISLDLGGSVSFAYIEND